MKYLQCITTQFLKPLFNHQLNNHKTFSCTNSFFAAKKKLKNCDAKSSVLPLVDNDNDTTLSPKSTENSQNLFPDKLMRRKQKSPQHFYVADNKGAELIVEHLKKHVNKDIPFIEINPGPGFLTRKLLAEEHIFRKILLFENEDSFIPYLEELHSLYPEKVKVKHKDLIHLWKLAYQDKIDNGTRIDDLFIDVPKKAYTDDPNITIFAGVGSHNFFKHLLNSLVFQTSILSYGRCEMFFAIPPPLYIHLTCDKEVGYLIYRATSMLFQIMFEHEFIGKIPREHFVPRQAEHNLSKGKKLTKVKSINPEYLYFVKVVPRRNLYELCPIEDMPALWYFVKQNLVSRKTRIIPNLEKWIPGCGPRLIVNSKESASITPLIKNLNSELIPKYSTQSTTMSKHDYFPYMNIFTQFGDLTPSQMLSLFTQFRSWPEYNGSSFLASLENSLLKMEASADEGSIDGLEDIIEEEDSSIELDVEDVGDVDLKQTIVEKQSGLK